jgi:hypothetical protein
VKTYHPDRSSPKQIPLMSSVVQNCRANKTFGYRACSSMARFRLID